MSKSIVKQYIINAETYALEWLISRMWPDGPYRLFNYHYYYWPMAIIIGARAVPVSDETYGREQK